MTQAETEKSVSEIKEKTVTEEKRIDAEGELAAQLIRSKTMVQVAKQTAEGKAESTTISVEA